MKKLIITESDKSHILNLYGDINNDIVITEWLSPDENYVVFLDDLYDVKNKVKLGNIWEDYNTLKTFLHHTFSTSDLPKQLKENAEIVLNNKLLLEGKQNLNELKSAVKLLVNEGVLSSFKNWVVKTGKSTVDGFVEFAKDTYKGAKNLIDKISKGEWKEVFKLLGQGVVYLFRKIRSAMYHPVGMILDAILIATGIGKGVQMVVWGIIVALDIYELVSGNYEEQLPMWQRLLFLGVDVLGLATSGVFAKAAKALVAGKDLTTIAKSPAGKKLLVSIVESAEKAPSLLSKATTFLAEKFPKGSKFISGILGKVGKFLESLINSIKSVIGVPGKVLNKVVPGQTKLAKGARAAIGTTALVGGIGTGVDMYKEKKENEVASAMSSNTAQGVYDINNI
jgi:general stress protein CsbA